MNGFTFILKIYLDDSVELGIITCQCFAPAVLSAVISDVSGSRRSCQRVLSLECVHSPL